MFDNKKSTGSSIAYQGAQCEAERPPEPEEALGAKLETTHYTVNRIISRIDTLRSLLFGETDPRNCNDSSLQSIEDAVNSLYIILQTSKDALSRLYTNFRVTNYLISAGHS